MNLPRLALAALRARALNTALTVMLLALGIATVVVILLVSVQLEDRLRRDAAGIDIVVGPKGSATQLVLAALYQLDAPTGSIPWNEAQKLSGDLAVRSAIPVALGNAYSGFRIVATTPDYVRHYGAALASGRLWEKPFEAVLGADVAARMRVPLDTTFEARAAQPYRIVGVLARTGTVIDRVVVTDIASMASAHLPEAAAEPDELVGEPPQEGATPVSAVLVQCVSAYDAAKLAARINTEGSLQAAVPENEIARLFKFIGVGREVLWGFAIVLMLGAGVTVFIALYDALIEHRQDIAVMRVLGAGPGKVMALLLLEGVMLAALGVAVGLLLGHALTSVLGLALTRAHQVSVTGWMWDPRELAVVAFAAAVGFAAAFGPAWRARRIDIAATLAR